MSQRDAPKIIGSILENKQIYVTLDEFVSIHDFVRENMKFDPPTFIFYRDRRYVFVNYGYGIRFSIFSNKKISLNEFDKKTPRENIRGDIMRHNIFLRLKEEFITAGVSSLISFFISIGMFFYLSGESSCCRYNSYQTLIPYKNISHFYYSVTPILLLMSFVLFLVIFSLRLFSFYHDNNFHVYKNGTYHKHLRDDKYLLRVSLVAISSFIINLILVSLMPSFSTNIGNISVDKHNLYLPMTFSLGVLCLMIQFISFSYYVSRFNSTSESEIIKNAIDET